MKWIYSATTAALAFFSAITGNLAIDWVKGVNQDRKAFEAAIHELQFRAKYLHGEVPAAPIVPIEATATKK